MMKGEDRKLEDLKIGDKVYHDGDSGFCHGSVEEILNITTQYEELTGEPYGVIHLRNNMKFDIRSGWAMTTPTAYYIVPYWE